MTLSNVVWHGTEDELLALSRAVGRNCTCPRYQPGASGRRCPAHQMLFTDQRAADGLLFARRIARRLEAQEWLRGK